MLSILIPVDSVDDDCQETIWPSQYKSKCTTISVLSHQQKKSTEWGGDWNFAELCIDKKYHFHTISPIIALLRIVGVCETSAKDMQAYHN